MTVDHRPSATVVVIGNEVLAGKVVEQNASYLVRRLREIGVRLVRVVMIPDDVDDIGETVRTASERSDLVFTTGGVGPTHDDITVEAIAKGFGVPTVHDPTLVALVERYFAERTTDAHRRLALVPEGSELVGGNGPPWPTVLFRNVYILPGIPRLMAAKFDAVAHRLGGQALFCGAIEVSGQEADICDALDEVVAAWPAVEIGSYPRREPEGWLVRLTVESVDQQQAEDTLAALAQAMDGRVSLTEGVRSTAPER